MSNHAELSAITFTTAFNLDESYGFILNDTYGGAYCTTFEQSILDASDKELLLYAVETMDNADDAGYHILVGVREGSGITINGKFYDSDEVNEMLESV